MAGHPLQTIMDNDSELMQLIRQAEALELGDGALPKKYKLLIAMALDAAHGAIGGVHALAIEAMQAGATRVEILEAVRVAHFVTGVGSVYTAGQGLAGVFEDND
jgi:alkylhydroperoxidase/carboxymuconolactone decarboxylase family protein YurZ